MPDLAAYLPHRTDHHTWTPCTHADVQIGDAVIILNPNNWPHIPHTGRGELVWRKHQ